MPRCYFSSLMRLLITNDDGINGPGLLALCEVMSEVADITVVSTVEEKSGSAHAITLARPLRAQSLLLGGRFPSHVLNGTPADCVKFALQYLMDSPPDMVLSGINFGSNSGLNIHYSGTVAAATEGAFCGIPSFAVSLAGREPRFGPAARLTRDLVLALQHRIAGRGILLNLNIPARETIRGVRVLRQSRGRFVDRFQERQDPRQKRYYWLDGDEMLEDGRSDHDDWALSQGYASLTPLSLDWTAYGMLEEVHRWVASGFDPKSP